VTLELGLRHTGDTEGGKQQAMITVARSKGGLRIKEQVMLQAQAGRQQLPEMIAEPQQRSTTVSEDRGYQVNIAFY
jgi:hypothetical protein